MCTNYVPSTREEIADIRLGAIGLPPDTWPAEAYPGSLAPLLIRGDSPDAPVRCMVARFGLVPHWCRDAVQAKELARMTYNARSETAFEKPSYRGPWHSRQWALAPMRRFFEPCWEDAPHNGGRSVRWAVETADSTPFAVAGLWDSWRNPVDGSTFNSFTLLTVNADGHAIMGRLHRPEDEKRMPVIIAPDQHLGWLHASAANAMQWMQTTPAQRLKGYPSPRKTGGDKALPVNLSLF